MLRNQMMHPRPTPAVPLILVVDDSRSSQEFIAELLLRRGYQVRTANDGREALTLAQAENFDLVITDIFMPNMDGLELLVALRELQPTTPRIAVTAGIIGTSEPFLNAASAFGAAATFLKPFVTSEFLECVDSLLRQ
jgi:CheY-like chemotaxis protein